MRETAERSLIFGKDGFIVRDIRLIGLDIDETTLNSKKEMTPRVKAAIEAALADGIVVLAATGRNGANLLPEFISIPGVRYALTANGAVVRDLLTGEVMIEDCFDKKKALELFDEACGYEVIKGAFIDGKSYTEPVDFDELAGVASPVTVAYLKASRIQTPDLRRLIEESSRPVEKFSLLFKENSERQRMLDEYRTRAEYTVSSSLGINLEINTATANKGAALLQLGAMLGFEREQVMAVGDGLNDVQMIKAVGYGVAMANAEEEVLAVADAVTLSCNEDGVALAIESVRRGGTPLPPPQRSL